MILLNKCDLLPHLTFDADLAIEYAHRINPKLQVIRISATSGEGMPDWLTWIRMDAAMRLPRIEHICRAAIHRAPFPVHEQIRAR